MDNDDNDSDGVESEGEINELPPKQTLHQTHDIPLRKERTAQKVDLNALTNSLDSLSLVPPTIRFGRGGKRRTLIHEGQHTQMQKSQSQRPESQLVLVFMKLGRD